MAQKSNTKMFTVIGLVVVVVIALGYIFIGAGNQPSTSGQAVAKPAAQATATSQSQNQNQEQELPMAPDFTLHDLNNNTVKLSDYRGKVVFVNFWATWCGPCRMEIPSFIELVDKYGKDGFVVLGIAVDPREFNKVPDFVQKMGMNYPVLLDETGVSNLYGGISSIPTTFVIDRQGRAVYRIVGSRPKNVFEEVITSLL
ncbi:MAG TPA: TlpA family protein disulfide reductase [Caldithrix abyssi]|uniref:TlpA family protein disulfide reductase n=1 Tax=Caldithrix abyssi TaxID=187145 RepID=A0A7V5PPR6_CALAY|nr:TlpA family protein disulfide reductase [Caldithrix abyssi]